MKSYQISFGGGEVSPEMFGRLDDARRQAGAAQVRNMVTTPQGSSVRRHGTTFVREVKDSTKATRVESFTFATDQALAIEIGEGYFRFHADGATLIGGDPITPTIKVLSVNGTPGVMQMNLQVAHSFHTGDPIAIVTNSTGVVPVGTTTFRVYYAINIDSTHIKVASSRSDALLGAFLDLGAMTDDVYVCRVYSTGDFITYVSTIYQAAAANYTGAPPGPVAQNVTQLNDTFTTGSPHGFFQGASIVFSLPGGATLVGVTAGPTYFAIPVTSTTFKVATTYGGAALNPVGTHTGVPTVNGAALWTSQPAETPFEVSNSYAEADLFDIDIQQSNDVLLLTHASYPAATLTRYGARSWVFASVDLTPQILPPTGLSLTASDPGTGIGVDGGNNPDEILSLQEHGLAIGQVLYAYSLVMGVAAGFYINIDNGSTTLFRIRKLDGSLPNVTTTATDSTINFRFYLCNAGDEVGGSYVVTAVSADNIESDASAVFSHTVVLGSSGAFVTFGWTASPGAVSYRIYKKKGDEYGFLGQTDTTSFTDDGLFTVDTSRKPPLRDSRLSGQSFYPATAAFYEQRVLYGGLRDFPQDIWGTVTGTLSDTSYHIPVQDSDRIYFRLAAGQRCAIRHIVPMDQLIILTDTVEFRVTPINDDALTPTSVSVRPQSRIGASAVKPLVAGASMVFCANRGGHVYEMSYSSVVNGFDPDDIALRAAHLFDGYEQVDSALTLAPWPIMWFVSSSGKLLGLTYIRNQNIAAWHAHETDGVFESVCSVPEGGQDSLYVVVRRTIDGSSVRYIERLRFDIAEDFEDRNYLDCSATYEGSAQTAISGLDHLEGEAVVAFANGIVRTGLTVASGAITLPVAATVAHVGLPMTATLQNLPAALQVDGYSQGGTKNINTAWLRVVDSARFRIGPTLAAAVPVRELLPTAAASGPVRVSLKGSWNKEGQVTIVQSDPLPLTVVSMTLDIEDGDR